MILFLKPPLEVRLDFEKTFMTSIDKFMKIGAASNEPSRFCIVSFDQWMELFSGGKYVSGYGHWKLNSGKGHPISTRDAAIRLFGRNSDRLLTYLINNNWNTPYT